MDYDIIAHVDRFDAIMWEIGLGGLLSERANATSGASPIPNSSRMPAEELHARYLETGETPDQASLLTPQLEDLINHLYRADLRAFGYLFNRKSAHA